MMARARKRFDIDDPDRELHDDGAATRAASLAGWLIVLALLLTLMAAS